MNDQRNGVTDGVLGVLFCFNLGAISDYPISIPRGTTAIPLSEIMQPLLLSASAS